MKKQLLALFISNCCLVSAFAQPAKLQHGANGSKTTRVKTTIHGKQCASWTRAPFDYKVFIQNLGQCAGKVQHDSVLYSVAMGHTNAYFTNHSITFRYLEEPVIEKGKDPDQYGPPKRTLHIAGTEWMNSSPAVFIEALDKQNYYQTIDAGNNKTVKTYVFKKVVYHNLYTGIDVEYSFPQDLATEKKYGI